MAFYAEAPDQHLSDSCPTHAVHWGRVLHRVSGDRASASRSAALGSGRAQSRRTAEVNRGTSVASRANVQGSSMAWCWEPPSTGRGRSWSARGRGRADDGSVIGGCVILRVRSTSAFSGIPTTNGGPDVGAGVLRRWSGLRGEGGGWVRGGGGLLVAGYWFLVIGYWLLVVCRIARKPADVCVTRHATAIHAASRSIAA